MKEFLINLLYAVITAAVPVLTVYLVKLLDKVFNKAKIETDNTIINDTIAHTLDLIMSAVISTSQTFVDSLKASGTFDEAAQKKAFDDTKAKIMSLLSEESKEILSTLYTDIDEWIDVQIENAVKNTK